MTPPQHRFVFLVHKCRWWARRALKAIWWLLTPWRMPARIAFLKNRTDVAKQNAAQDDEQFRLTCRLSVSKVDGRAKRSYELATPGDVYTYIPPRIPTGFHNILQRMRGGPRFSIVVPVYNTPPGLLEELLQSVEDQWYPNWELILVNDCSTDVHVIESIAGLINERIVIINCEKNIGISAATNLGIRASSGDYIVFADHDDELTVDCLFELAQCAIESGADYIYSDEDKIAEDGSYTEPFFKPDWSPDTLMSTMYTCHVSCVRRDLVLQLGGLRGDYNGSQDWDFVLRVTEATNRIRHIPKILYHWRIIPQSLSSNLAAKPYAIEAGRRARQDALARRGLKGNLEAVEELPGYYRTVYEPRPDTSVSIIIPTRDNCRVLMACLKSIARSTSLVSYEIIVIDNGSKESFTLDYLAEVRQMPFCKVKVLDCDFNWSALNNTGAEIAQGDVLLFLNDDIEVITADWLDRISGFAQLDHVGAVGAKLLYPTERNIQHVGIVNLPIGPVHAFLNASMADPCYFARAMLEYNWIAISGACMAITKSKFLEVGGFDEALPIAYNDVDMCFRLSRLGYANLVSPGVVLLHHESLTRGLDSLDTEKQKRLQRDLQLLYIKNPDFFNHDPFYNVNLSSNSLFFEVA